MNSDENNIEPTEKQECKQERDISIDILKCIGILLIILAHVDATPDFITQIRSFDVPMLVILSAMLSAKSYENKTGIRYIIKRVVRLIVPTWIFLVIFYIGSYTCNEIFNLNIEIFNLKNILGSFLFVGGIGYVWIIRVYILTAIAIPILMKFFKEKYRNPIFNILIYIGIFALYEASYYFFGTENNIINYVCYYFIGYGILCSLIGINLEKMTNKKMIILGTSFLVIWVAYAFILYKQNGYFVLTYTDKYPPRLYYLSYAIGVSVILYYLVNRLNIFNIKEILNKKIVIFISSHSMWIYLWHILILYILKLTNLTGFIEYVTIIICSLAITYVQSKIVKKLDIKNKTILAILN